MNAGCSVPVVSTAASAPIANNSESPGKNGVTTNPVSQNTIANKIAYTQYSYSDTNSLKWRSRCRIRSIRLVISSMSAIELVIRPLGRGLGNPTNTNAGCMAGRNGAVL